MAILRLEQNNVVKDIMDDTTQHFIGKGTFAFALGYVNSIDNSVTSPILLNESYFRVSFDLVKYTKRNNSASVVPMSVPVGLCQKENYKLISQELYDRKNMSYYVCPQNTDYYLMGDMNSEEFTAMQIYIHKWNTSAPNNTWADESEIDRVIRDGYIDIALLNAYFDFDEYEDPIKTYLSTTENLFLTNDGTARWFEAMIQENEAHTSDGRLYNEPFKKTKFYSVTNRAFKNLRQDSAYGALGLISFGLSRETLQYERSAYNLNELVGFLGGLYDALFFIGYVFVSVFQTKLYNYRMISKLYSIENQSGLSDTQSETELPHQNIDYDISDISEQWQSEEEKKNPHNSIQDSNSSNHKRFVLPQVENIDLDESLPEPEETHFEEKAINKVTKELSNRRSLQFSIYDLLPDFRALICCK